MKLGAAVALVLVALVGGTAMAEDGRASNADLAAFGLSGVDQASDVEGMEVRGKFLFFFGATANSFAAAPGGVSAANSGVSGFGLVLGTNNVGVAATTSSSSQGFFFLGPIPIPVTVSASSASQIVASGN